MHNQTVITADISKVTRHLALLTSPTITISSLHQALSNTVVSFSLDTHA